ncbi:MAG: 5-(carboxyamino)imidazole ribonucleotide mutase [Desulforudis sp.]|jgi:5-(carboxyamino)imidazole ribonucleotide mutase|nr:MAG: 5-(carboxyamino)imidazole ribonucleotide mutase [Desulforudis sp.]
MGSDSDLEVMKKTAQALDMLEIPYEISVISAHRTPERALEYSRTAAERGLKVIIAAAGMAAHLAGVMAAHTTLPVIGVPIKSGALNGQDALYSTVQMPPGVPVATVGINGAKNAGILAAQIIGVGDAEVRRQLESFKRDMTAEVEAKDAKLQSLGWAEYLKQQ